MLMGILWDPGPEKGEGEISPDSKVYKIISNTERKLGRVLDGIAKSFGYRGWECVKAIWRNFVSNLGVLWGVGGEIKHDLPRKCR